jgi:phosphoglycerate dehydrogenase-like enzyme
MDTPATAAASGADGRRRFGIAVRAEDTGLVTDLAARLSALADIAAVPLDAHGAPARADTPTPDLLWIRSQMAPDVAVRVWPGLRWAHYDLVGLDRLNLERFKERAGLTLTKAHDLYGAPMAATAVASITAHLRALYAYREAGRWAEDIRPRGLVGSRIVFLGTGTVAVRAARALDALGACCIGLGHAPRVYRGAMWKDTGVFTELPMMAAGADALVIACPLTEDSRDLVDAEVLCSLAPGAIVVNLSRGEVLREDALLEAIDAGVVAAAVLDAFRTEPLPVSDPLWGRPEITVLPHRSWYALGQTTAAQTGLVQRLVTYRLTGWRLPRRYVADPARGW